MPFINGRFVMRSQLLMRELGEAPKIACRDSLGRPISPEKIKALQLGYSSEDARLFGALINNATWKALLEAHDTGDLQLSVAECEARKDWKIEREENLGHKRKDRQDKIQARKLEKEEKKKLLTAKREAAIAASFKAVADAKILVTYWLDTRNGNVLYQRPTAIQEPKFYTQLKSKALLDDYLAHAALYGKKEAVAIYGNKETLIGKSLIPESKLDVAGDTRQDYVAEYSHFPMVECEQIKRPEKWTEQLTRKELLAYNCCTKYQIDCLADGSCFVDTLGRRWWRVSMPRQFAFEMSPAKGNNQPRARIMYCR